MGSPYLSSNETILLSTNNIIVNTVPAEAILTSERLMLVDARHAELRPQDIPFSAIETVTTGESDGQDPMLFLSLVTAPGVTQALGIVFPQSPRIRREAERDEWAARLKELSTLSIRNGGGTRVMEILPPWVSGPRHDETLAGTASAAGPADESQFRNPPLVPRKPREPASSTNTMAITSAIAILAVIALVAGAYLVAPSLFGQGVPPLPPVTTAPTEDLTLVPTPVPATVVIPGVTTAAGTTATPLSATVAIPAVTTAATMVTTLPASAAEVIIPETGVWLRVNYEGSFSGSAGAPGRFINITGSGDTLHRLPVKDEIVSATIQKQDNSGRKLTVEIYEGGKLVRSVSVTAPKGTVNMNADLKNA